MSEYLAGCDSGYPPHQSEGDTDEVCPFCGEFDTDCECDEEVEDATDC